MSFVIPACSLNRSGCPDHSSSNQPCPVRIEVCFSVGGGVKLKAAATAPAIAAKSVKLRRFGDVPLSFYSV